MRIVINRCFGGFNLSDEAFELYLAKKGIKYYKYPSIWGNDYYTVPKEKYEKMKELWHKEDGDYRRINEKNWYLSSRDVSRDDPILIEVIKELKKKANGMCADLKVVKIPDGIDWEIDEYDGLETIEEKHNSWR